MSILVSTYRPGTQTRLECRFNKTTHHIIIVKQKAKLSSLRSRGGGGGVHYQAVTGEARTRPYRVTAAQTSLRFLPIIPNGVRLWPPEVLSAGMCRQVTNKGMGGSGRTSD